MSISLPPYAASPAHRLTSICLLLVAVAISFPPRVSAQDASLPTVEERTRGMDRMEGFFNLFWDDGTGSLFWEIAELDTEFLYQISMGSGLGSNPVGIDRGQLRGTHVLEAKRIGPRVLLMEPNYQFLARTDNPTEVQAVRDAFAPSVHWLEFPRAFLDGRDHTWRVRPSFAEGIERSRVV